MTTRIAIAADHGGFGLKEYLKRVLIEDGFELVDFGNSKLDENDDYPDFVVPMAEAIANKEVERGIAVCGSGVGACIAVNKLNGVRACLINDTFSAHQGVEDDNMNVICLGGRILGNSLALEIVRSFLSAKFSGADRHLRRLSKIAQLESKLLNRAKQKML